MSNEPVAINSHPVDIFIGPGEVYFGGGNIRLRTLLGSCVSLVFWHPRKRLGGMCHFMLPERIMRPPVTDELDGRYADEAVRLLLAQIREHDTRAEEYTVKLIGGGHMFPGVGQRHVNSVAWHNIDAARRLVERYRFNCTLEHLGESGYRQVILDVPSGDVWIKHQPVEAPERDYIQGSA